VHRHVNIYVLILKSTKSQYYSGLYLCSKDIATSGLGGDIQGGWMAANAGTLLINFSHLNFKFNFNNK
jgi:hypothetical protein